MTEILNALTPCGSGKKYKQCCGKQLANPDKIRENASFSFSENHSKKGFRSVLDTFFKEK